MDSTQPTAQSIEGSLLGLMLGDSIGLPYEGLSPRRIQKLTKGEFKQSLILGKGMVSDDTEHAIITARSLCKTESPTLFGKSLAWGLRWWFARLPAGVGMATGRALIKSWIGFPHNKSGVYSAGNGPAMRAPILGVVFGHQPELLKEYVGLSTRITHTDPKAYIGALAVAEASYLSSQQNYGFESFKSAMHHLLTELPSHQTEEFWLLMEHIEKEIPAGTEGIKRLIEHLKLHKGVSGYTYHTLPIVLLMFFVHKSDFKTAINQMIALGGDTDTTAAILGGIIGSGLSKEQLPEKWLSEIWDYPCTPTYVSRLAVQLNTRLSSQRPSKCSYLPGPFILIRNLFFLVIVLLHGFRRLLPPY
ncbi:ADP-ribosylglycohydrolase family protein [Litoribacillus peritrichatus]|uniref:ADP-ribosylglycohydrolase family protein n=1 Tax=Litoribacillus peritrichatus TaxID=718191 RepID=A0ABP7MY22_9GAMM